MFYVGQKVVCVDVRGLKAGPPIRLPKFREVYTVRKFFVDVDGEPCVLLQEITNPPDCFCIETGTVSEPYFLASRFRPIVERKTDISIFKRMLHPEKADA